MKKIIIFLILVLVSTISSAETIKLKSGRTVEGEIVERTDEYIKVDFQGVGLTFYIDEIESLGEKRIVPVEENNNDMLFNDTVKENNLVNEEEIDAQSVFDKRISDLFSMANHQVSDSGIEVVANKLWDFAKDYPKSRFADDAKFVLILTHFTGASVKKDAKLASLEIKRMEEFLETISGGKIEEFTVQRLKELGSTSGAFCIPYEYIVVYMKGFLSFDMRNYQETVNNFLLLKDKLDFSNSDIGPLVSEIYMPLAIAYRELGNKGELNNTYNEVLEKFPDNEKLIQFIGKLKSN